MGILYNKNLTNQHEVHNTLHVNPFTEVLVVAAREPSSNSVMSVHHTRHTVKSESIKTELFNVEAQI